MTLIADLLVNLEDFWKTAFGWSNDEEHDAAVALATSVQELLIALGEEPYTMDQALEEET